MKFVPFALLFVLLATPSMADEVVLKNDDKISGKVSSLAGGKLILKTPHSGSLKIDWAQVVSVTTEETVKVKLETGEMLEGKLSAGAEGRLKIETQAAAEPVEVELAKVKHLNKPPVAWHGNINLAARSTEGNTETTGIILSAAGARVTEKDKFQLRVISRYAERDEEIIERNTYGLARYQHVLYGRLSAYTSAEFLSDKFKDLRLGTVLSAGASLDLIKHERIDLTAEAGVAYVDNNFYLEADEAHMGARLAGQLRVELPLGFEFRDYCAYYSNADDPDDWQMRNEATLSTALGAGWSLVAGVITEHDHLTNPGIENTDNTYFLGLGYTF